MNPSGSDVAFGFRTNTNEPLKSPSNVFILPMVTDRSTYRMGSESIMSVNVYLTVTETVRVNEPLPCILLCVSVGGDVHVFREVPPEPGDRRNLLRPRSSCGTTDLTNGTPIQRTPLSAAAHTVGRKLQCRWHHWCAAIYCNVAIMNPCPKERQIGRETESTLVCFTKRAK